MCYGSASPVKHAVIALFHSASRKVKPTSREYLPILVGNGVPNNLLERVFGTNGYLSRYAIK
ncbi:hypothetical protein Pcaca05_36080 [Pectobacterium carotovorum subsp. carotovorum]|nr:hypothetical protein Pcaca05_36080 [Pectobacterium carotovorum subsp. carotovorum]